MGALSGAGLGTLKQAVLGWRLAAILQLNVGPWLARGVVCGIRQVYAGVEASALLAEWQSKSLC